MHELRHDIMASAGGNEYGFAIRVLANAFG
jgi:hypothetical protein